MSIDATAKNDILILGLGSAASHLVSDCDEQDAPGVDFIAADTDHIELEKLDLIQTVEFGESWASGNSCNKDSDRGERAASEDLETFRGLIRGRRFVVVMVFLGGGAGGGAARVVARALNQENIPGAFLVTLPASWEGASSTNVATEDLKKLSEANKCVYPIPSDFAYRNSEGVNEILDHTSLFLKKFLLAFVRFFAAKPMPLKKLDIAELADRRKNGVFYAVGTGAGRGEKAVDMAWEEIRESPFFDANTFEEAGFGIALALCAQNVTTESIGKLIDRIESTFSEECVLIQGVGISSAEDASVEITLLVGNHLDGSLRLQPKKEEAIADKQASPSQRRRPIQGRLPGFSERSVNSGLFVNSEEKNLYDGSNLDIPTFKRKKVDIDSL